MTSACIQSALDTLRSVYTGRLTVEDSSNNGAEHLHAEGDARRELAILPKFQVLQEGDALLHRVRAIHGTVHVRDRTARFNVGLKSNQPKTSTGYWCP